MRRAGALLLLALALPGCADVRVAQQPSCPAGQERLRTAQLFFGQRAEGRPWVSEVQFRKFVDEELTTRFPDGLTVLDGGDQWKGQGDRQIREAAKVVLIVLPKTGDPQPRLDAVRQAYRARFAQDSVMRVTPPSCVSF
jgi:hypothetical protein